jgi:hypothetical protein
MLRNLNGNAPQAEQVAPEDEIEQLRIVDGLYKDHINGFSIVQPDSTWKFTPKAKSRDLIKLDITHESGKHGIQVRVHNSQKSFEEFLQSYIVRFFKDMKNPPLIADEGFSAQNLVGRALSFDGRARNGYFLKSYVFPGKNKYFALQGGCLYEQKDRVEPILDQIAASLSEL